MAGDDATKATSSGHDDTVPATDDTSARSSVPAIAPPPDARYQLGNELGRGGMGRVVEAFDTHLQRTVALKEVLRSGGSAKSIERRFQREVRITARLEHAGIVPLYDSGRLADGRPFYVMRRVSGRPLDEAIARAGELEGRLALLPNVLSAIEAIAHAHGRGVLHRDIKPQNILIGELGETVVIDWGLAKVIGDVDDAPDSLEPKLRTAADSLQTQVGSVFGTPGFMAPEQARGDELGPPGDVYALGATLYQLIAGKPPFKGTSATEVITSTLRHRYEPLTRACPGAPAELSTIIDKALAFEPDDRYVNASALAEDVRRFLTGQLVAAHRYTRRQRLARFARRHRAPLAIAALASVGLASLSWFSVHRILRERDIAESASIAARDAEATAEQRAVQLRERADQLALLHARSLLDTDPTQAIASLKQIASPGVVHEEARAIARAAAMRGVAWGLPTVNELTVGLEMSPDGKRLLQLTRTGVLHVIDLDARREVTTFHAPVGSRAMWVDGGRQILLAASPPLLFDPGAGRSEAIAVAAMNEPSVTEDGSRVAFIDGAHRLQILDVKTRQVTQVPGRTPQHQVQIAPGGEWIAIDERIDDKHNQLVVTDPTGRVLAQRPGTITSLAVSRAGALAVATWDEIVELSPLATPVTFTPVPIDPVDRQLVHSLLYAGPGLRMVSARYLLGWSRRRNTVYREHEFADGAMLARAANHDTVVMTSGDSKVYVLQGEIFHVLPVPQRPQGMVRVAATPASSRIVATAGDALLVWDLASVLPEAAPALPNQSFATETMLVSPAGMTPDWQWFDLVHHQPASVGLATDPGLVRDVDIGDGGRALVIITRPEEHNTAVIAYPGGKQIIIDGVGFGLARLVDGNGIVYSPGKGRIMGRVDEEPARELVTLDGDVVSIAARGKLAYAALSKKGELVRGRFDGGDFARAHLPDAGENAFVVDQPDGNVLVASSNRLLQWTASLDELARFSGAIDWIHASPVGLVVRVLPGDMYFVPPAGDRTPRRIVVGDHAAVASSGARIISINAGNQLESLELPSLVTWTLPRMFSALPILAVSPSGRRVVQQVGQIGELWEIPEPASDFAAWLDELTNATEIANHVHWPWQPG